MYNFDIIAVVGPTASGKTKFAAHLASALRTEIISTDSRQIYRRMDLGTGKDLQDYIVDGQKVPYHLIDIAEPGYKYNLFEYQRDFADAFRDMKRRDLLPVVCGGTGLYVESVIRGYTLLPVPENAELRRSLEGRNLSELTEILKTYKTLHNTTDVDTPKRAIRAIEIQKYYAEHPAEVQESTSAPLKALVVGIDIDRETRRRRISERLAERVEGGMIDEVNRLLAEGIAPDDLIYYGLEYKYLTLFCTGRITKQEMLSQLEIAIHQFAKRQMTWFRGMERRGTKINWIGFDMPTEKKVDTVIQMLEKQ